MEICCIIYTIASLKFNLLVMLFQPTLLLSSGKTAAAFDIGSRQRVCARPHGKIDIELDDVHSRLVAVEAQPDTGH